MCCSRGSLSVWLPGVSRLCRILDRIFPIGTKIDSIIKVRDEWLSIYFPSGTFVTAAEFPYPQISRSWPFRQGRPPAALSFPPKRWLGRRAETIPVLPSSDIHRKIDEVAAASTEGRKVEREFPSLSASAEPLSADSAESGAPGIVYLLGRLFSIFWFIFVPFPVSPKLYVTSSGCPKLFGIALSGGSHVLSPSETP